MGSRINVPTQNNQQAKCISSSNKDFRPCQDEREKITSRRIHDLCGQQQQQWPSTSFIMYIIYYNPGKSEEHEQEKEDARPLLTEECLAVRGEECPGCMPLTDELSEAGAFSLLHLLFPAVHIHVHIDMHTHTPNHYCQHLKVCVLPGRWDELQTSGKAMPAGCCQLPPAAIPRPRAILTSVQKR